MFRRTSQKKFTVPCLGVPQAGEHHIEDFRVHDEGLVNSRRGEVRPFQRFRLVAACNPDGGIPAGDVKFMVGLVVLIVYFSPVEQLGNGDNDGFACLLVGRRNIEVRDRSVLEGAP